MVPVLEIKYTNENNVREWGRMMNNQFKRSDCLEEIQERGRAFNGLLIIYYIIKHEIIEC